jgi:hypothetical protein
MPLDPQALFQRIATDVPQEFHKNLLITGSLAAAYHFREQLKGRAVNTKDADLIVQPAGSILACQSMANKLLDQGWMRTNRAGDRAPQPTDSEPDQLPVIRLYPPDSKEYFVEFLNLPDAEQAEPKKLLTIELQDGWSVLPSFRFMRVLAVRPIESAEGLRYASPAMLALANLLAHPSVGTEQMSDTRKLRSAKDLGRVVALARLAGRDETERWTEEWKTVLNDNYASIAGGLIAALGNGLRELLQRADALQEAWELNTNGLLSGLGVTLEATRADAERLMSDVIEPLQSDRGR